MKQAIKKPMKKCICCGCTQQMAEFHPCVCRINNNPCQRQAPNSSLWDPFTVESPDPAKIQLAPTRKTEVTTSSTYLPESDMSKSTMQERFPWRTTAPTAGVHQILGGIQNSGTAERQWFRLQCLTPGHRHSLTN